MTIYDSNPNPKKYNKDSFKSYMVYFFPHYILSIIIESFQEIIILTIENKHFLSYKVSNLLSMGVQKSKDEICIHAVQ